jgi:hypothetical protein
MIEFINSYKLLAEKSKNKRSFGRSKGILESNTKMYVTLNRLGGFALDSRGSRQSPVVDSC